MNVAKILETIKQKIASLNPSQNVQIMAVTKTHPFEAVQASLDAGIAIIGENRVQESEEKYKDKILPDNAELHLIGGLQSNKAARAAKLFSWVHSIEKEKTARKLGAAAAELGKKINILIEVNTSLEEQKHGIFGYQAVMELYTAIKDLPGIRVRGLMTVGPLTSDRNQIRASFKELAGYYNRLKTETGDTHIDTLSMGMSGDYDIAVEEGATIIRLGSILFGSRNYA